ncbi:Uncharacterised protein [uncultured archaeon]|nr:Uncharacterised protein [uncultured archaeon]
MSTKTIFETETCGRCGGSGRHSYCQMYGDTCFGCSGSGKRYSKRGQAAGDRWYIVPFRLWKYCDINMRMRRVWDYDRSQAGRQFVGSMMFYAGKQSWRTI